MDIIKKGKKIQFRFRNPQGLCYLEIDNKGKMRGMNESELRKGTGIDEQDKQQDWEERWFTKIK